MPETHDLHRFAVLAEERHSGRTAARLGALDLHSSPHQNQGQPPGPPEQIF